MMSSTLGAPLGGTTRGGHQGLESVALSFITPPNFGGGGGICFPGMVVVASAEPNVPVTCCAEIALPPPKKVATASAPRVSFRIPAIEFILCFLTSDSWVGARQRAVNAGPHRPTTEKDPPPMYRVRTPRCCTTGAAESSTAAPSKSTH